MELCEELLSRPVEYWVWNSPKLLARPQVLKLRKKAPRTCSQALVPPFGGGPGTGGEGLGASPFSGVLPSAGATEDELWRDDICCWQDSQLLS